MTKKRSRADAQLSDEDIAGSSNSVLEQPVSSMENLWKEAFPVGTEWDQYDKVYAINWSFSNLEEAFEEGGVLYGKRVYLFGCTEPQLVEFRESHKIMYIPAVVAVTSPFPPSDKIGIKSVQMEGEMIVPMKEMKMDWMPYIPDDLLTHSSLERYKCEIFTLKCTQRRVALRHLKQERIKKYEYCLPYIYQPLKEEEPDDDTIVSIMYSVDDKPPLVADFDWELDEISEYTESFIRDEVLPKEEEEKFIEYVTKSVKEQKKKLREAKLARKKAIEEMSDEKKAAYESMKLYKFYPVKTDDTPDLENLKVPFINRYYGKADKVL